jgi:hypothetical protein
MLLVSSKITLIVTEFLTSPFYLSQIPENIMWSVWEIILGVSLSGALPNKMKQFRGYRENRYSVGFRMHVRKIGEIQN